jgi:hypothetical protein
LDRIVVGGVSTFDVYSINEWTESYAVGRFINEQDLQLNFTNLSSHTSSSWNLVSV